MMDAHGIPLRKYTTLSTGGWVCAKPIDIGVANALTSAIDCSRGQETPVGIVTAELNLIENSPNLKNCE